LLGRLKAGIAVNVSPLKGTEVTQLSAKHVIIATGSKARELPGAPFDEKMILSNDGALNIDKVPKNWH
jgi:dihydrolipoamide dehydrogenase